jgi:DNA primase
MNPKGSSPGIFNGWILAEQERVFITEGAFDALSFIEAGAQAVATNSKNNGQALIALLQRGGVKAQQFIICPDNDPDPKTNEATQRQAQELCQSIQAAGYTCIVYNVSGKYHDANDALRGDRAGFIKRIAEAQEAIQREVDTLPGLLQYEDLLKESTKI